MSYIESELEALEREQEAIDLKARACEKKLRNVMNGISTSKCRLNSQCFFFKSTEFFHCFSNLQRYG